MCRLCPILLIPGPRPRGCEWFNDGKAVDGGGVGWGFWGALTRGKRAGRRESRTGGSKMCEEMEISGKGARGCAVVVDDPSLVIHR